MNTIALSRHLGKYLDVQDPANLPDDAILEVLTAINAGLADYYQLAPDIYRTTPLRYVLKKPTQVTLNFQAKYSNALTTPTFSEDQYGCSVAIAGYNLDNRVQDASTLYDQWLGDDLSRAATVFSDCILIPEKIERICSYVTIRGLQAPRWRYPLSPRKVLLHEWLYTPSRPEWYWMEPLALDQGGTNIAYLRVHPYPMEDFILSFDAILAGAAPVTFQSLLTATELPVQPQYCDSIVVPLCVGLLTESPMWKNERTKRGALNAADDARNKLKLLPGWLNPPINKVQRPWGF